MSEPDKYRMKVFAEEFEVSYYAVLQAVHKNKLNFILGKKAQGGRRPVFIFYDKDAKKFIEKEHKKNKRKPVKMKNGIWYRNDIVGKACGIKGD